MADPRVASSANAYRDWVNRRKATLDKLTALANTRPSQMLGDNIKETIAKLKQSAEGGLDAYKECILAETDRREHAKWKERAEELEQVLADSLESAATAIAVIDAALRPRTPPPPPALPAAAPPPPIRTMMDSLKPPTLCPDSTPYDLKQWKRKFGTYFRRSGCDLWAEHEDKHNAFFGCIEPALETRILRHEGYNAVRSVLPSDPPTNDSLIEILDAIFLANTPLFTRRLEFWEMKQDTGRGETVEAFVELLEARAELGDIHLMTFDEHMMFRMLTGVQDKGMLTEWRRIENPTMPEMKRIMKIYMNAKKQEKATRTGPKENARAAKAGEKSNRGRSPSRGRMSIPDEWKGLCMRCAKPNHIKSKCNTKREDVKCGSCNRMGHVSDVCLDTYYKKNAQSSCSSSTQKQTVRRAQTPGPAPQPKQQQPADPPSSDEDDIQASVARVRAAQAGSRQTPTVRLRIRQPGRSPFDIHCTPDTGATHTVISADIVARRSLFTRHSSVKLYSAKEGDRMESSRATTFSAAVVCDDGRRGPRTHIDALVSSDLSNEILISWHDLKELGVIPQDFPNVSSAILRSLSTEQMLATLHSDYADVLSDYLQPSMRMKGEPCSIKFKKGLTYTPFKVLNARPIPLHMRSKADKLLEELIEKEVIDRVPTDVTTDNLFRGSFVLKPGPGEPEERDVRLVTDYMPINPYIERPVHPFPSPNIVFQSIDSNNKWFAKLDALHGYFQLPIDKESQLLTAFLLPQGKFYYKVAPMGLSPSGDWWCQRSDEALAGLPGVLKLVDDILVQAATKEELLQRIRQVLQRCRQHGMILSKKKLEIGQEVSFAGHIVGADGVRPDPVRLDAISNFPTPTDVTALRSFLGLANQLGTYLPDLAAASTKLRVLLRKNVSWVWTPEHDDEFNALKNLLTSATIVKHFDPSLRSVILTDASAAGIGFALVQHGPDGAPRLISCGSRSLNPAEKRYAPVELEALGAVFAIQKCSFYMLGSPTTFTLITDHQPLIGFFQRPLNECTNSRLQRMRLKVVGANVRFEWQAGKHNLIADALSRFPVSPEEPMDSAEMEEDRAFIRRTITSNDGGLEWLCDAADEDPTYQEIVKAKCNGSSVNHLPIDHPARAFRNVWEFISVEEGFGSPLLIYDGTRIIVPPSARSRVLDLLHIPHAGQVKTKKAAQQLYYWPGMNAAIHDRVAGCEVCTEALPSKPPAAPLDPPASTSEPMQAVGMDLFAAGSNDYLVMVDRHSGYPWVHRLTTTTSLAVTRAIKKWFEYFGLPKSIRSDGGPQFRGEAFKTYCKDNGILHETSSPYNPESNGLAEAAVKNVKKLLIKCIKEGTDFQAALAEFRNCPRADGCSPAHIMFRRGTRGRLPSLPSARNLPAADADKVVERRQASYAEVAARKRIPAVFSPGQQVWVQDPSSGKWNSQAEVMSRQGSSYTISFDGGLVSRRNERFLRPVKIPEGACEEKDEADENTYSNMNVNPLADSADAAPRPALADADSPSPPGDGGEKFLHSPSLPHSLAPHAGLRRSARLQKRSEDSLCRVSGSKKKEVRFFPKVHVRYFLHDFLPPPTPGCHLPTIPRSILRIPHPSTGHTSTSSSRAPSSSSVSSTTSSTAAAPSSSLRKSSTTGRSANCTGSTSSPAGPPTTPPTGRSSASSPTSATPSTSHPTAACRPA